MIRSYSRRIGFLGAVVAILALVIACGTAEQQAAPQGKSAPQQPAAAAAAAAAADPSQPVAPDRKAPATDTSAGGFQTGAQAPDAAKPTAVAVPADLIKRGGVLRQAHRRSPLHFRMDIRSATDETTASAPIFNQLLALQNPDFVDLGPDLAESWVIGEDGQTFTFKLASGVINHNGNPWTSSDAKFTLETLASTTENRPPHERVSVGGVSILKSIETPDATTLIVNLNQPDGLFLANMSLQEPMMYTEADYDELLSLDDPVGTGPFRLTRHLVGEKLEYEAHADYFKEGLPYLDGIETFIIRDTAAKMAAFEAGRIDIILMGSSHGLYAESLGIVANRHPDEITFYPGQHPVMRGLKWNWREEGPWQDKRVRQAINFAINRDTICDVLENCIMGDYMPSKTFGVTTREGLATRPGFALPGPDKDAELAKAKELMVEAGFPDGFEVEALCRDTAEYRDALCPLVEFLLRDTLNIRLKLDVQESGAWVEKQNSGDWLFEAGSSGNSRVDHPFDWLDYAAFCGEVPVENVIGYCNETLDDLLRQMRVTSDIPTLQGLTETTLALFYDELPYLPLFWPARFPVTWNYVKNVPDEHFSGQYSQARRLEQVWLDK
jgi:peptide/nickel transport system substrate-binding protein